MTGCGCAGCWRGRSSAVPVGILVHGDNHVIVRGPLPSPHAARQLARRWEWIAVGDLLGRAEPVPARWQVSTREFREDLEWAVVLRGEAAPQPNVVTLLDELRARGVAVHETNGPFLPTSGENWSGTDA